MFVSQFRGSSRECVEYGRKMLVRKQDSFQETLNKLVRSNNYVYRFLEFIINKCILVKVYWIYKIYCLTV